jgi:PAS domain S-box-containing protein
VHGAPQFQQTLLECLTEAALDGVIVIDAEGRIVALNQRFADLWGLSPQAVQARDRAAVTARIIEQLRDPQSFVSRSDYLHAHRHEVVTSVLSLRDGRTVEHYSTPIWGNGGRGGPGGPGGPGGSEEQNGAFYGRMGWYRDVTDRTRAEATLRASRDELDAILRGVADGVTVQDETGRFVYANAAAADLAGFPSPETFLGATAGEISARLTVLDAEGRPFPYSDLPGRRALRGEPAPEMLVQFRRLDSGEVRWALTRARAIRGADGEPLAIDIFHDLTQRLLAERRLRFLAEAGAMLPASLDEAELLDGVTRLAVRTLAGGAAVYLRDDVGTVRVAASSHRDPQRAALMAELEQRYPPLPEEHSPLWQTLQDGSSRLLVAVTPAHIQEAARDAEHLRLLTALGVASALYVPLVVRGRVVGALALFATAPGPHFGAEDLALTEEVGRRAALALDNARLYARSRDAVRAREEFLSIAAHELRTPVTVVTGLAQLLLRDRRRGLVDEARLDRALQLIAESSARLALLTDDLLDVSRLQTGHFRVRAEPVDLPAFVAGIVERDAERLGQRHRLRVSPPDPDPASGPDSRPLRVNADPLRLEQVLVNLIENAVKYSPEGGPIRVTVRPARPGDAPGGVATDAGASASAGGGVVIEVQDAGIGLPPGAADAVFEPFGRAPNATNRQIRGMGLGLYLCRRIVERHGGRIWARSPGEGQGSTFSVWLPALPAPSPAAPAGAPAGAATPSPPGPPPRSSERSE